MIENIIKTKKKTNCEVFYIEKSESEISTSRIVNAYQTTLTLF